MADVISLEEHLERRAEAAEARAREDLINVVKRRQAAKGPNARWSSLTLAQVESAIDRVLDLLAELVIAREELGREQDDG
jgi:hypothetical protein